MFVLCVILSICAAATITNVEKIEVPQNNDAAQDLNTAESAQRQFGHGGKQYLLDLLSWNIF